MEASQGQGVPDPCIRGKNERIEMDRERYLTKGDTETLLSAMPMLKY